MESKARLIDISKDYFSGKTRLTFEAECQPATAEKLLDKDLRLKATRWRVKRSLNANNYMWELISQIQSALQDGSSMMDIYLKMLERYGSWMYIAVTQEEMNDLRELFRIVKDRGANVVTTPSGRKVEVRTYQCYKGSSIYDTKEMSVLLSGVVREAEALGIDTATPDEREKMIQLWQEEQRAC